MYASVRNKAEICQWREASRPLRAAVQQHAYRRNNAFIEYTCTLYTGKRASQTLRSKSSGCAHAMPGSARVPHVWCASSESVKARRALGTERRCRGACAAAGRTPAPRPRLRHARPRGSAR